MDTLSATVTKDWLASLNWSREIVWQQLLEKLFRWQQQQEFLFTGVQSDTHLLGRLYGYTYAQTEGTGLTRRGRQQFAFELVTELLMLPCPDNRLSVYVTTANREFMFGLVEGRRLGRPRPPLSYEEAIYDALLETLYGERDDHHKH